MLMNAHKSQARSALARVPIWRFNIGQLFAVRTQLDIVMKGKTDAGVEDGVGIAIYVSFEIMMSFSN